MGLGLFVDYDRQREAGIARTYGIEPLGEAVWQIRANVREAKVRPAVSTRAWVNLGKLHAIAGMSYQACLDRFLTGWSEAEKAKALQGVRLVEAEAEAEIVEATPGAPPVEGEHCPVCSGPMVRRVARKGRRAGQPFLGCAAFPRCTGTRKVQA